MPRCCWQQSPRLYTSTLDTNEIDCSTIASQGYGCTPSLWQVLQTSAEAAPAPQMPSMHDAPLKSQPAKSEWLKTERMEALTVTRGV